MIIWISSCLLNGKIFCRLLLMFEDLGNKGVLCKLKFADKEKRLFILLIKKEKINETKLQRLDSFLLMTKFSFHFISA